MAKRKIAEEKQEVETVEVLNPLELRVTKNVVGVLETNIAQLEEYVNGKLEEYKPEFYKGDADSAKKDRAELNNSKKFLSQTRINLMRELMKPYEDFETRCKTLEKKIDTASGCLDVIVKAKEEQERQAKRMRVHEIWLSKNFNLFSADKVFNQKWLNKTTKESEISAEMDAIIKRTYSDLQTIETNADAETLKAHYLMTLDLSETLAYGQELARQREIAEREAREREERVHKEQLDAQIQQAKRESVELEKSEKMSSLVADASETEAPKPKAKDYIIKLQADEKQILAVQFALRNLGILFTFKELEF